MKLLPAFLRRRSKPATEAAASASPTTESRSFWSETWKRFRRNRLGYFSLWIFGIIVFIAVFADILANNKPLYARLNGKTYFPVVYDYAASLGLYRWDKSLVNEDWKDLKTESAIWPPVRYLPGSIDIANINRSPFGKQELRDWKFRHFLGTDPKLGRDVLAGLIHGTRISLTVGLVSVSIAATIGIFLGAFAGYFGDNRVTITRAGILFLALGFLPAWFYAFFLRWESISSGLEKGMTPFFFHLGISILIFLAVMTLFFYLSKLFNRVPWLGGKVFVWADIIISRTIEIVVSVPVILLIIALSALVAGGSIYLVMVLIGLTSWPGIARLARGEMLKIRGLEYIQAAQSIGFSDLRIIIRHAIPNAMAPVFVSIAFGIAAAILVESTLSFLGIGVPVSTTTWGSLLNEARGNSSSWWLAIFPGFAIFLTVTIFNLLGEALRDAMDPRLRN